MIDMLINYLSTRRRIWIVFRFNVENKPFKPTAIVMWLLNNKEGTCRKGREVIKAAGTSLPRCCLSQLIYEEFLYFPLSQIS